MSAPASFTLAFFLGTLGACTPSQDEQAEQAVIDPARDVLTQKPDNCLLLVWQEQQSRNEEFDLAHDIADGGAISCATGTSASKFAEALADLRTAARSKDRAAILQEVGLPLLYIDAEGNRRELTDPADVGGTFDEVFDDKVLGVLREIDLDALTVVPDQGAFVELGSVWLVVDRDGGRPRIVTVNKQALGEAAVAVRAEAKAGGGEEIPLEKQGNGQNGI